MYGRKVKLRFFFVIIIFIILILSVFLVLKSLEENVVYFQSPSEINSSVELNKSKIRVGGMVKKDSISISSNEISFIITDFMISFWLKHSSDNSFKASFFNIFVS